MAAKARAGGRTGWGERRTPMLASGADSLAPGEALLALDVDSVADGELVLGVRSPAGMGLDPESVPGVDAMAGVGTVPGGDAMAGVDAMAGADAMAGGDAMAGVVVAGSTTDAVSEGRLLFVGAVAPRRGAYVTAAVAGVGVCACAPGGCARATPQVLTSASATIATSHFEVLFLRVARA